MKEQKPQQLDRDWLSVQQTAAYLGCSTGTVRNYIRAGALSCSQLVRRGKVRISAVSIERVLEKSRRNSLHN